MQSIVSIIFIPPAGKRSAMPARKQQAPPASGCPEQERAGRRNTASARYLTASAVSLGHGAANRTSVWIGIPFTVAFRRTGFREAGETSSSRFQVLPGRT